MVIRTFILITVICSIFRADSFQKKHINAAGFEDLNNVTGVGRVKATRICVEKADDPFLSFNDFEERNTMTGEVVNERLKNTFKF